MMFEVPLAHPRRYALRRRRPTLASSPLASAAELIPFRWRFSWAGGKPRMSTWRRRRICRGSSPSTQKRCPPALCCCTWPGCKSPRRTVYGPRCENSPGPRRKLVWRRIPLRACPVVETNGFNRGWYDFSASGCSSWRELPLWIIREISIPPLFADSIEWVTSSAHIPNEIRLEIW